MDNIQAVFEKYKDIKEIKDIIDEINQVTNLYSKKKFIQMRSYINWLTQKYFLDTFVWNTLNQFMPQNPDQQYVNAVNFLRNKGNTILIEKCIKVN